MPALALVLYLAFLAVAFGYRTWRQLRSTGTTGYHGISGTPRDPAWWGGVLFVAALACGLAGPGLQLLDVLPPLAALDAVGLRGIGAALAAIGIGLTVAAQVAMGTAWRVGIDAAERTDLVTHGPFGLARNPVFTAMIACAAGLALLAPNVVSLTGPVLLVTAIELQVRCAEEPYLGATHGDSYARYAARVGRFVPRLGRVR